MELFYLTKFYVQGDFSWNRDKACLSSNTDNIFIWSQKMGNLLCGLYAFLSTTKF